MAQFHNYIELCVAIGLHATAEYPMTAPALEQLYELPSRKTELLIRRLVQAGVLQSVRGHYGGYYILKPDDVSLAAIYDVFLAHKPKTKTIFERLDKPICDMIEKHEKLYRHSLETLLLGQIISAYDKAELPKRELSNFVYYI